MNAETQLQKGDGGKELIFEFGYEPVSKLAPSQFSQTAVSYK